jgi:hypothetical protein
MAKVSRRHGLIAICLCVLALSVLLRRQTLAPVTGATLRFFSPKEQPVEFPFSAPTPPNAALEFSFHIRKTALTPTSFIVVPDDHLESIAVNGVVASLREVDPKRLDDFQEGLRFPLGKALSRGDNRVVVRVLNRQGQGGLDVRPDPADWRNSAELGAAALACLVLLGAILRWTGCRAETVAIVVAAVALRLAYLWVTPYSIREHDIDGHLEYIQYLLDHRSLPRAAEGYEFYHPPLYFILSAIEWWTLRALGFARNEILKGEQLQSMLSELGFAGFSIATVRLWIDRMPETALGQAPRRRQLSLLFAALILLWPASILHAARIGNDDLVYLFFSGGLYWASRWWFEGRDRDLYLAAFVGALGVLTKTNIVLMFAVLGVMFVVRLLVIERERRLLVILRRGWPMAAILLSSTALALGRALVETLTGRQQSVLIGNMGQLTDDLIVGNRAENYLTFDLPLLIHQPFTSPLDDDKGRQFFWNYLFKTSLFGEWEVDHPWARLLAVALSVTLLAICMHVLLGTLLRVGRAWLDELPMFLTFGFLLLSLILLRIKIPRSCSGDFRYVLPVLTPLCFWYVRGIGTYQERGWVTGARVASLLGWVFVWLSALFILVIVFAAI